MRNPVLNLPKNRENEKGAAMVMALMVSFLLLVASAGMLLETTSNTQNVMDSTSEQQAFSAAESGIQAAVNVLRSDPRLPNNRLINANPVGCATAATEPEECKANRIDYLKALEPDESNLDPANNPLDARPRLSRWLNYDANFPDRVPMGGGAYAAQNGYAYSLDVSDPDHTGSVVTYSTRGKLGENDAAVGGSINKKTYGAGANRIEVEFVPRTAHQIDTVGGSVSTDFGTFKITKYGLGACMLNYNRLQVEVTMTQPYFGVRVIRGYVEPNATTCGGALTNYTSPNVRFDSITFTLQGSKIDLVSTGGHAVSTTWAPANGAVPSGFTSQLVPAVTSGVPANSILLGTMSSPEPIRLLVKSTGYGPRGATKELHAIIQKNFFNGLTAPATLTLIGPPNTTAVAACPTCIPATPAQPASTFHFALGNSNAMLYSGQDAASTDIIPPIGAWGDGNVGDIFEEIDDVHRENRIIGEPSDITTDTPPWLSTPANLDEYVQMQAASAYPQDRYFANGVQPPNFGNPNGTGLTICDGDCTLTGDGGGILIVTGKLTLHGRFSFKGIIIVTGQAGVDRRGAGNGVIEGNMIIAPYVNSRIQPESNPVGIGFLAPQYDLSGGGASTIQYNSTALNSALQAVSNFVQGVVEK
ncbi:MAG TPA: hypothetical protein VMZ26_17930 [Pyrinomonadaceae bacterium]|nr:hypothetical protein [Pyrinomonadaceae bacterium]